MPINSGSFGAKENSAVADIVCGDGVVFSGFIMVPVPAYSQYLTCTKCGSQVDSVSNYCNFCGAPLRPQIILKICPRCKTKISATAKYCSECGQIQ